uniref:VWFA domain-containing protein n=1 Tax=Eutreptiella gymnastica TaxID=73025 RepID=A0A7S1IP40_9EUGL|mmetsp:Transcript_33178/g.59391  ORF Transcript_33178/g.59391 Transcript_33178/m.59391 type:complete len:1161 (+) Transcript_33178:124-3606(+)
MVNPIGPTTYQYVFHRTDQLQTGLLNEKTLSNLEFLGAHITLTVRQFCTKVNVVHTYRNSEAMAIEAAYVFPIEDGWTVCRFEAEMEDKTVSAVIGEREEKHKEYRDGCFIAAVGTLKPGEKCTTSTSYIVNTDYNPRGNTMEVIMSKSVLPLQSKKDPELMGWRDAFKVQEHRKLPRAIRIDIDCSTNWPIESHQCNMDATLDTQGTELTGWYEQVFQPGDPIVLDDDFHLHLQLADARDHMNVSIVKEEGNIPESETYALTMSIVPSFSEEQHLAPNTEIVFLIDCSGSMHHRIREVERCAKLCLQGLPQSVRFNVILFGDTFKMLDEAGCLDFTTDNLLWGRSFVHKLSPDMGGTNLLPALKAAYALPMKRGYCRQVVLFTDGVVAKPYESIRLAKDNAHDTRLFVFHLDPKAKDCQHMEQLALASAGQYTAIGSGDRLTEPLLTTLDDLLQPCLTQATLTYCYEGNAMRDAAETPVPPIRNVADRLTLLFNDVRHVAYAFGSSDLQPNPVVKLSAWFGEQHLEWTYHIGDLQTGMKVNNNHEGDGASVWHTAVATARIRELTEYSTESALSDAQVAEVLRLSSAFTVMSPLTSMTIKVALAGGDAEAARVWTQDHIAKKHIAHEYAYTLPRPDRDFTQVERPHPTPMDAPCPTVRPQPPADTLYQKPAPAPMTTMAFMRNVVRGIVHQICRQSAVDDLVFAQNAAGHWVMNSRFARMLDSSTAELLQALPKVDDDVHLVIPAILERDRCLEEERMKIEAAENERRRQEEEIAIRKAKVEMEKQLKLEQARAKMTEDELAAFDAAEAKKKEEEAEKLKAQQEKAEKERKEAEKEREKEAKRKEAERKKLVKKLGEETVRQQEEEEARKAEEEQQRIVQEAEEALQREDDARAAWESEERTKHITNIWATALALAYMDLKFADQTTEFSLVARRGMMWLAQTGVPNADLWPEQAAASLKPILAEQAQILQYELEIRQRETENARQELEAQARALEEERELKEQELRAAIQARHEASLQTQAIADDDSSLEEDEESRRQRFAAIIEEEQRLAHESQVEEEPEITAQEDELQEAGDETPAEETEGETGDETPAEETEGETGDEMPTEGETGDEAPADEVGEEVLEDAPPADEDEFPSPTEEQLNEMGEEEIEEDVEEEEE